MDVFTLNVTHNGDRFPIKTTNTSFIGDVKQQLSDCYNIRPVKAIRLVLHGREVFDDFMIEEYNIDSSTNVTLVLRPVLDQDTTQHDNKRDTDTDTEDQETEDQETEDNNDDSEIVSMDVDD